MPIVDRRPGGWVVFAVVLLSVVLIATPANAAKNGARCKIIGATEITKGVTFTCNKSGKKLKWVKMNTNTISNTRVTSDRVDVVTGFQVKAIYVVPADGVDNSHDTNGYIAEILDEGNKYLRKQIGLQIPIDKHALGYDIQYLKSNLTTAYLQTTDGFLNELLAESLVLENPGLNRKNYIFFIDVKLVLNDTACGFAAMSDMISVVAIGKGSRCTGEDRNFNDSAASTWLHELIHNFGVDHTLDAPCDLMAGPETPGTCPSDRKYTLDTERTRYIGGSTLGQDILKLRVWDGMTDRLDREAICFGNPVPRADGFKFAYCPTGTQTIGVFKNCGNQTDSSALEEFVDGKWKNLGAGIPQLETWGPNTFGSFGECPEGFPGASKQLTVATPGISLYRWMVNGKESEQFKVIWVR